MGGHRRGRTLFMPVLKNPEKAAELVALLYTIEGELAQKLRLLAATKLSLILLEAPPAIAKKMLTPGEMLSEAETVALRAAVAGKYFDAAGREASVVVPTASAPSFVLYPPAAYKEWLTAKGKKQGTAALAKEWRSERDAAARKLAGEQFETLFDRLVLFQPAEGFDKFVPRLLTPAAGRDLLALCRVEGAAGVPHVKIPKPKSKGEPKDEAED